MTRTRRGLLVWAALGCFVLAGCTAMAPGASVSAPVRPQPEARLQALADNYVESGKVAGVVIAFGRGDGPATFISAGRVGEEATLAGADSLWRIFSMTKPITSTAAMKLVEDGRLQLDQPVSDLIPAFREARVLVSSADSLASRPASRALTVRHLLTHSGGLTYQFLDKGPLGKEYQRLGLFGGRGDAAAVRVEPASLEEFADRVASLPLAAEPGTSWRYSVSSDVLGRVIEVASGMPFEQYVQSELLDPLGMRSTYWTVPQPEAGRMATLYAYAEEKRVPIDPGASSGWLTPPRIHYGGSGLVSSARDYDRFLQMLAGEGRVSNVRVLRPETVRMAMSNLLPVGVQVVSSGTPDTAVAEGFDAGGWVYLNDVPGGVRDGTYGWFGAAGTIAFIDPQSNVRVTVMANYFPATKWPLHREVVQAIYSPETFIGDPSP